MILSSITISDKGKERNKVNSIPFLLLSAVCSREPFAAGASLTKLGQQRSLNARHETFLLPVANGRLANDLIKKTDKCVHSFSET